MHNASTPAHVAGIRNFAWVERGVLARGEQPPLTDETFRELRAQGIGGVVSLRPHAEQPSVHRRISSPLPYDVEDERAVAHRNGLGFAHAPLEDFSAPPPEALAAALRAVDQELERSQSVYVHCRAGAGRAGLVSGAWLIAHGGTGDEAAGLYQAHMDHLGVATGLSPEEWHSTLLRIGQPHVLWALGQIAQALGSPLTRHSTLLPPVPPAEAEGWEERYWVALAPWRTRRR